ncbi:MAG: flagellar biosynthetic protein FliO [Neorhizobium sp.]|nr:flagellar biosynthetic protein FliO [Neorhizobium sp.]
MIEEMMSAYGGRLTIAVIGVGVALLCLIGILRFLRGRNGPSPFVRGGRNRNPRLQVLDAAAVDARRRLVLVRRDNVEHLVMIGGPTDIVIESGISAAPDNRPMAVSAQGQAAQPPVPDPRAAALAAQARTARPPEPRSEARRDAIAPEPVRSIAAPSAAPMKMEPLAAQQQITAARPVPAGINPATRQQAVRPEALRSEPIAIDASSADRSGIDDAARALEAARGRGVLQEGSIVEDRQAVTRQTARDDRTPAPQIVAINTQPAASAAGSASADRPKALGSDFEKILEEEMANNLASRDTRRLRIEGQQPEPLADGAEPSPGQEARPAVEPTLQDQVARIFGEMSASRDK